MNKHLFVTENREIVENLKVGQMFSAYDSPLLFNDHRNEVSGPANIVYLHQSQQNPNRLYFLVILKNGNNVFWAETKKNIETGLDRGWFKKTNRKLINDAVLQQIRLPKDIENVKIVSDETELKLPVNIQNNLLTFLGQPDNIEHIPLQEDEQKTDENEQKAGKRNKSKKNTRKSRKTTKSRKQKKDRKSRKHRK
uniref:Uncharacterized protein n=1 Tax=viral metagenome TaxID=1070528 RepID=A0A6C0EB15_9ZZZZ